MTTCTSDLSGTLCLVRGPEIQLVTHTIMTEKKPSSLSMKREGKQVLTIYKKYQNTFHCPLKKTINFIIAALWAPVYSMLFNTEYHWRISWQS